MSTVKDGKDLTDKDKAALFVRAAEIMQERGWGKGNPSMGSTGPVCILGACKAALEEVHILPDTPELNSWYHFLVVLSFDSTLRRILNSMSPFRWNDISAKNKEEVVEVLLKAAEVCDERSSEC